MSLIDWPDIQTIQKNDYSSWWQFSYGQVLKFKKKIRENINQFLPYPASSLLGAMLVGDKSRLSTTLKEKLNISGVRHITAVSGMHVAILTSILMTLLIGLGLWRGQSFYLTIVIISLFIIMTGLQPSAIRAGIMGGFFLLAQYLGRMNSASRIIVFVAAVMLLQNPLLLRLDVGFQLSFLAILGIIYLLPIFQNWFRKTPNIFQFRNILAMTLSAQVFTLPILIYNFGYVSLVAPLTNILIVPLLPYIIGFGFLFTSVGIIWQPLGWVLSFPCWFLIGYSTKVIDIFSHPWAAKIIENIHWFWLVVFYLLLAFIVKRFRKKTRLKFLEY
ncbi:ComEC/Rec2 family competence protein [Patescibacteria group bacterium]|nr:ComEC/Rec2 family competence protein [Patescibacteria group bacterium]